MGDKVQSIHGHAVHDPREPNASASRAIKDLLERVESGEVVGVVFASQYQDDSVTYDIAGSLSIFRVVGALHSMIISLLNGSKE